MYVDIITIIAAGFAAAGVALILNRLTGRRLPRWIIPAFAGAGMIAMSLTTAGIRARSRCCPRGSR